MGITMLNVAFGLFNALGRVLVSVLLDCTRHHRFGGVFAYLAWSMSVFVVGLLFLCVPRLPGPTAVVVANVLLALGYGGMLAMVPLALRLRFGGERLGLVYGLLYTWVAAAQPAWTAL